MEYKGFTLDDFKASVETIKGNCERNFASTFDERKNKLDLLPGESEEES